MLSRIPAAAKILAVTAMFVAAPLLVYRQLETAADDNNRLLAAGIEAQGRMAAAALRPWLDAADGEGLRRAGEMTALLGAVGPDIKLLFRPAGDGEGFYYVASHPPAPAAALESERRELARLGVLERLKDGCEATRTPAQRFTDADGATVLLTSVTPVQAPSGCWVVVTADRSEALASTLGRPYWATPAAQWAAAVYVAMAAAVIAVLTQIRLGLRGFARLARELSRPGAKRLPGGFAARNRVPELAGVAAAFDRMTATLGAGAEALRLAAHENAHAFKTPLAVISQCLEPLRRPAAADPRCARAVAMIDKALARLDGLVVAARSLDETLADSIDPPRERVDLSRLTAGMVEDYARTHDPARLRFVTDLQADCVVACSPAMLEIVLQNLLDNAVDFSPPGGEITVSLRAGRRSATAPVVELRVADRGPGIGPAGAERLFERYVSLRPPESRPAENERPAESAGATHFGLGLWIVRRNVEAAGGTVAAADRAGGGFEATVVLPRVN